MVGDRPGSIRRSTRRRAIRPASPRDAEALAAIYNHYVVESIATFELKPIAARVMAERVLTVIEAHPWLVIERDGAVAGYAYATAWKGRPAYRNSVETTIYLAPDSTGQGLGRSLYAALLERLVAEGLHTAIGGIALPNPASVRLHEALGFEPVARFHEVGFKFGRWIDVGYWQKMLEEAG